MRPRASAAHQGRAAPSGQSRTRGDHSRIAHDRAPDGPARGPGKAVSCHTLWRRRPWHRRCRVPGWICRHHTTQRSEPRPATQNRRGRSGHSPRAVPTSLPTGFAWPGLPSERRRNRSTIRATALRSRNALSHYEKASFCSTPEPTLVASSWRSRRRRSASGHRANGEIRPLEDLGGRRSAGKCTRPILVQLVCHSGRGSPKNRQHLIRPAPSRAPPSAGVPIAACVSKADQPNP